MRTWVWRGFCFRPLTLTTAEIHGSNTSLAILHCKSFAAILSVFRVHLGHTNRSVSLSHESQREIALLALPRPIPDQQGEVGERVGPSFRMVCVFWRFAGRWHPTIRIHIRTATTSHDTMPLSMFWGQKRYHKETV